MCPYNDSGIRLIALLFSMAVIPVDISKSIKHKKSSDSLFDMFCLCLIRHICYVR